MNNESIAEAYKNPVPLEVEERVQDAAAVCPVGAIILE